MTLNSTSTRQSWAGLMDILHLKSLLGHIVASRNVNSATCMIKLLGNIWLVFVRKRYVDVIVMDTTNLYVTFFEH